jgi:hypothetical protein
MSAQPSLFRVKDVTRLYKAARSAGITAPRVDVLRDGTLRVSSQLPQEAVEAPKPAPDGAPAAAGLRSWD